MSDLTIPANPRPGGPFRLLKYFIITGFLAITLVTGLLGAFLYTGNVNTLVSSAENYAKLLAENLNYNIFIGFYAPLKARNVSMDLEKWEQFGALDSLIKDFTYGLKIKRIKLIDKRRKIIYSSDYDLIGKYEQGGPLIDAAFNGKDHTFIHSDGGGSWLGNKVTVTYFPLREVTGNYWMLGEIYGVLEINQDVTDQYAKVQRSVVVIIITAAILMLFLFVALTLIVRRGERILIVRSNERTELERQLQQAEKLASIGQLVATIAHEIRNPLGIIRSSAEMLMRKANPQPERIRKFSGVIYEEATRLNSILTDFLEFARPRAPKMKKINVGDVLARVRDNLESERRSREITWLQEGESPSEPYVAGDPDLLYQAFLNIAMNAFEAVGKDGVVSVTIPETNGMVRIDISDTGHGISEESLDKIFTPFFTTNQMGTGLGLSVVRNIISAHNGEIKARNTEDGGAVFSIMLPSWKSSENERTL